RTGTAGAAASGQCARCAAPPEPNGDHRRPAGGLQPGRQAAAECRLQRHPADAVQRRARDQGHPRGAAAVPRRGAPPVEYRLQALPHHILEQPFAQLSADAFAAHPYWTAEYLGLGPYRIEVYEPGAFIEAAAFDSYVRGRPKIDRIRVVYISDPNTVLANLLAEEVHIAIANS